MGSWMVTLLFCSSWSRGYVTYSSQDLCLSRFAFGNELHSLHGRSTTSNDNDILVLNVFSIQLRRVKDLTLELVLTGYVRHLSITARSDSSNYTVKLAIGAVVDDPAVLRVFAYRLDPVIKFGLVLQSVLFPDILDLFENLITLGVAFVPEDGREEAVHNTVDL